MSLTKEEASDLQSLQEQVVEREKALLQAQSALSFARGQLDSLLYRLQHPETKR